jgi:hypothetical protein
VRVAERRLQTQLEAFKNLALLQGAAQLVISGKYAAVAARRAGLCGSSARVVVPAQDLEALRGLGGLANQTHGRGVLEPRPTEWTRRPRSLPPRFSACS